MLKGNFISTTIRELVSSPAFETVSALGLLINVGFMASVSIDQDPAYTRLIDTQNNLFFALLCVEALLNLIAQGPILYILKGSNRFDLFFIVSSTLARVHCEIIVRVSESLADDSLTNTFEG